MLDYLRVILMNVPKNVLFSYISNWRQNYMSLGSSCPACRATALLWKTSSLLKRRKQQQKMDNSVNFCTVKTSHFRVFGLSRYLPPAYMCIYISEQNVCSVVRLSRLRGLWVSQASSTLAHIKPLDKPCIVRVL